MNYALASDCTYRHKISSPWSWISFMFSAFYFFSFFAIPLTTEFVVIALVYYGIFAALYYRLTECPGQYVPWFLGLMLALGIIASGHNPSAGVIFGYTAFFAGFYLSRTYAFITLAAVCGALFFSAYLYDMWVTYFIFPSLIPAISMAFMGLYVQATTYHAYQESQNAEEKRQLVKVAERERIARDLHDTLGHSLSSIALKAQLAKKLGDKGQVDQALKEIQQVAELASETLSDVRQAISGYRKLGLQETLENLQSKLEAAGFTVTCNYSPMQLPANLEAALILIITESVTNIVRHSQGERVEINLTKANDTVALDIFDNGSADNYQRGNGLTGMQERIDELAGTLTIETSHGFHIQIQLPVTQDD